MIYIVDQDAAVVAWRQAATNPTPLAAKPTLRKRIVSDPLGSALVITGALRPTNGVSPAVGSLGVTGYFPTVSATLNNNIFPSVATLSLSGLSPLVAKSSFLYVNPGQGSVSLLGYLPLLAQSLNQYLNPGQGSVSLLGYIPSLAQSLNQYLNLSAGSYLISGYLPSISQSNSLNISLSATTIFLSGQSPLVTLSSAQVLYPVAGSVLFSGFAPVISQSGMQNVVPGYGSIFVYGYTPALLQTFNIFANPSAGLIILSEYSPVLVQNTNIYPLSNSTVLSGYSPAVNSGQTITNFPGAISILGNVPIVGQTLLNNIFVPSSTISITGFSPGIGVVNPQFINVPLQILTFSGLSPSIIVSSVVINVLSSTTQTYNLLPGTFRIQAKRVGVMTRTIDPLPDKDDQEVFLVVFDFSPALLPGETIASLVSATSEVRVGVDPSATAMVHSNPTISSTSISNLIGGGVAGNNYVVRCEVTTTLFRTLVLPSSLRVVHL